MSDQTCQQIDPSALPFNGGPSYFEIQADDPGRAVEFYKKLFGWQFERAPGMPIEYWRINARGARGGLLKRPASPPPEASGTNAFVCSILVENFDKTAARISALGGRVALPKFAVPGTCWQGYFIDPEGNTFGVYEIDTDAG